MPQIDTSGKLYTHLNGITGDVDGDVNLEAIPSVHAPLELDEICVDEFGQVLKAGDLLDMGVFRPCDHEINSSSLMDEAVLDGTKAVLSSRCGSAILKDPSIPSIP
uniref:Reverse transcriptase putative n=1 Tax=Albugo laibachii Nc14 TaxID=890382 RepID=F0WFC8_9STRA|nr:reverse transcriptase putative [Albugo laibachii Nc14]|eukprot:CCA19910.1 reverse transcriptase putative [Albugo laibachii Nc14]